MFKRNVKSIEELIRRNLRVQGLETPLLQKRVQEAWPEVAGVSVSRYTVSTYISNETLFVKLTNPALRADLSMRRSYYTKLLNEKVGSQVIVDVRFY